MSESANLNNNYGVVRTYYDPPYNTKLYKQYFIVNNKKEGVCNTYRTTGTIIDKTYYLDNKIIKTENYDEDEKLRTQIDETGCFRQYDENGEIIITIENYLKEMYNDY